jgi:hypothetical protein
VTDFASLHTYTGSAGGNTVGVAPCSNIYGLKIFDDSGGNGYISYILNALNVVKQRHVSNPNAKSVVSMSLYGYCGAYCSSNPLVELISSMYDLGILFAVAASNNYNDNACLYFPAAAPKAITVAASDQFDNFAYYSNTGPCVDIIAPGSGVNSACATCSDKSSYVLFDGTSMATPHVAGTLALLLQKRQVSFTTAPDIVTKALICDAAKNKIQNIPVQTIGTTVNLLLQVPKNDNSFGGCESPSMAPSISPSMARSTSPSMARSTSPSRTPTTLTTTNWFLRDESSLLSFRYGRGGRFTRIAFYRRQYKDYGTKRFYQNEAFRVLYNSGSWMIREETGVLYIRDMSSSADRRYAFYPGNGNSWNYGSGNSGLEVGTKVLVKGFRWSIQVENGVLMFRDMLTPGDHRFAFYQSDVNM